MHELQEFKKYAKRSNEWSFKRLIKNAPVLTTRSYLDMCRIIYDAVFDKEYISGLSTAELFCKARNFDYEHEKKLGILGGDWDSSEEFERRFRFSYHNEEIIFGGPKLYIKQKDIGWYGVLICDDDTEDIVTAVKMFNSLRKNNYPVRFFEHEKVGDFL